MALGVRGFDPIWFNVDLQSNHFDDTFYLNILENTIPYIPATVWHDPDMNVPWTNPIWYLANGTLPVDIYFLSGHVYRLEFRQNDGINPPSQNDPLIYEVNNYIAGDGGSTPIDTVASTSSNQITNPQFAIINFVTPYSITSTTDPTPIEVAPGWTLELTGTGSVTIERVALTSTTPTTSNAPYALRLNLSGWDEQGVILRQRFYQNGVLWANKFVSSTVTARVQGAFQSIHAALYDSQGALLADILTVPNVDNSFEEYLGVGQLGASTDTDTPPDAYIDYRLYLPSDSDIYVTSIQVVVQDVEKTPSFEQDSINRQIDHTFNYYNLPLQYKPIPSLLTGWDFNLNPAQFSGGSSQTIGTSNATYIWDQTVCKSVVGNVAVVRNAVTGGFQATNASASEAWYMLQYLSGAQARAMLGTELSVNVNAFRTQAGGAVTARVYLYRGNAAATIPTVPGTNSIGTIAASGVFTLTQANWTLIPRGTLNQASGSLQTVSTADYSTLNVNGDLRFNAWEIIDSAQIADTDKFAIVVTFQTPSASTVVTVESVAVVPGSIPTRPAPQTRQQVLEECEYYFEKSTNQGVFPTAGTTAGALLSEQYAYGVFNVTFNLGPRSFSIQYNTKKRGSVAPVLYSIAGGASAVTALGYQNASLVINTAVSSGNWTAAELGERGCTFIANNRSVPVATVGTSFNQDTAEGLILFQYFIDTRLGVV